MCITHSEDDIVRSIADEASAAPSLDLPARKEVSMRIVRRLKAEVLGKASSRSW
jgi:hypothetical protein